MTKVRKRNYSRVRWAYVFGGVIVVTIVVAVATWQFALKSTEAQFTDNVTVLFRAGDIERAENEPWRGQSGYRALVSYKNPGQLVTMKQVFLHCDAAGATCSDGFVDAEAVDLGVPTGSNKSSERVLERMSASEKAPYKCAFWKTAGRSGTTYDEVRMLCIHPETGDATYRYANR